MNAVDEPRSGRWHPAPADAGLRVGVLGTGYWAQWCHGTALAGHPEVELVGFWGRDPAKAAAVAARVGGRGFHDVDELFDAVDAVSIAVAPDVQAPLAIRAAQAGLHLLLEKPLALDLADADQVVAAVESAHVASLTHVSLLFEPAVQAWLDELADLAGRHGPWEGTAVRCLGSIDQPGSPYRDSTWRREKGGLWDLGPHALSLVGELLPPVVGVGAGRGMRDGVNVVLEHEGGAGSVLTLTVSAAPTAAGASVAVWGPGGRHELTLPPGDPLLAYRHAVDHLRGTVTAGSRHRLDARYGRDLVAVLQAAERDLGRPGLEPLAGPRAACP